MILFLIIALVFIGQILYKVINRQKIRVEKFYLDEEYAKFNILPNYRKKSIVASIISIILSLVCLTFPIALNISFYMQFPKYMLFGKINLLFTFVIAYLCFILMDLINNKILLSYIYEYKQSNPEISDEMLPSINLKKIFINDITNIYITIFITIVIIALYVFI